MIYGLTQSIQAKWGVWHKYLFKDISIQAFI